MPSNPEWLLVYGKLRSKYDGRAAAHIHTTYSDGLISPQQLLEEAEAANLDAIVIMDHDTIAGAEAAVNIAAQRSYRPKVIVGIEGTTDQGKHAVGIDIQLPIPYGAPVEIFNRLVHAQGGMTMVPHPEMDFTSHTEGDIQRVNRSENGEEHFDLIEIFNSGGQWVWEQRNRLVSLPFRPWMHKHDVSGRMQDIYRNNSELFHGVIGGPDAHHPGAVDDTVILFPKQMGFVEALRHQEISIIRKVPLTPVSPKQITDIYRNHYVHNWRRVRGTNGIRQYSSLDRV